MSKYFDGELLSAYEDLNKEFECKKENVKLHEQISDLEAKLAEKEKSFELIKELRKNDAEVLLNYKTEKYGLDKTIQELRKIKLSFPEKEYYYKGFENCERQMSSHIADLTLEVKELKQQLAEKEKKLYEANSKISQYECTIDILNKSSVESNQDKISFAVEQLEKVYRILTMEDVWRAMQKSWWLHNGECYELRQIIDNQIEELKKEI